MSGTCWETSPNLTLFFLRADDGGATPVQDERDSGSDVEDEGNEQHSGSENGSVGHRSEVLLGLLVHGLLLINFRLKDVSHP